jgi:hypothetical protein
LIDLAAAITPPPTDEILYFSNSFLPGMKLGTFPTFPGTDSFDAPDIDSFATRQRALDSSTNYSKLDPFSLTENPEPSAPPVQDPQADHGAAEPDITIIKTSTGVVVGDDNTVVNIYIYRLVKPQLSLDSITSDPDVSSALRTFVDNPDDNRANRAFRALLPVEDITIDSWSRQISPKPGGPDSFVDWLFGDCVMVFRSRDIEIGNGLHHTNTFQYQVYDPTIDVSTVLRSDAGLARDLATALASDSESKLSSVCSDVAEAAHRMGIEAPDIMNTGTLVTEPGLTSVENALGWALGDHGSMTTIDRVVPGRPTWLRPDDRWGIPTPDDLSKLLERSELADPEIIDIDPPSIEPSSPGWFDLGGPGSF